MNYHRPRGFAENKINEKGKIRKKYKERETPYEKLKKLPVAEKYLKENFSFEEMEKIAEEKSDNEFAEEMQSSVPTINISQRLTVLTRFTTGNQLYTIAGFFLFQK